MAIRPYNIFSIVRAKHSGSPFNIFSNKLSTGMLRPYRNASPLPECFAPTGMLRPSVG
ncbi:hypothetical protein [Planktothricoides raciborskii]|uniref:Uncharacterized protein n=1 Tax=Planktothricoides raciborskii FACHB-1370 TaxID=2949576 RepID=A0ABR8EDI8_9CYAN|nr:hypothetical protein [Planktothricoides raciborskii]MBD2544477.1 hypothetical protein [Planktothricoides raciborskii FACHB-1370]MBD2585957.1 hypothetical protein [Planktothricoides raciborskii FACHB-1261]